MVELRYSDEETTPLVTSGHFDVSYGTRALRSQLKGQGQPTNVKSLDGENWRSRLRDAEYRSKLIRSFALSMVTFCGGLVSGQLGPALLDLQLITHTNVQEASLFLSAASAGSLVGSAFSGFIYDRFCKNLLLIFSQLFVGLTLLAIPFCSLYWLMVSACFLLNAFRLSAALVANVEIFQIWGTRGATFAQALQFAFSLGGIIAPLVTEPFLASRNSTAAIMDGSGCSTPACNYTYNDLDFDLDTNVTHATPEAGAPEEPKTRIHFAFMITSSMCLLLTAFLTEEYIRGCFVKRKPTSSYNRLGGDGKHAAATADKESDRQENFVAEEQRTTVGFSDEKSRNENEMKLPTLTYVAVVMWISLFNFVHVGTLYVTTYYLTTYAVLQMQWSKSEGAFLSFVQWITMALARLFCIFVANYIKPVKVLSFSFLVWIPSQALLVLTSLYRVDWGVWLSTALCGAALSPIFASAYSWMNASLVPATGKVFSSIGVASNTGSLVFLSALGYVIENYGAIYFAYFMLGGAIINFAVFISLLLFSLLYLHPKYRCQDKSRVDGS